MTAQLVSAVATMRRIRVPALLIALGVVPVVAGVARLVAIAGGEASPDAQRFLEQPWPVTIHIVTVSPYAVLGALQFSPALRRSRWHRRAGLALLPLGLIAALSGLWMTVWYPWPAGDGVAVYVMRLVVGIAMSWSIVRGTAALVARDFEGHGAWMLRAYALGMGAGTQVLTHLPWFLLVDTTPTEGPRAVMMGLGWAINTVVAEFAIRAQRTTRVRARHHAPVAGALVHSGSRS